MTEHSVSFDIASEPVRVLTGALVIEAARLAGVDIQQPCGGQGRCGRCAVQVTEGSVRRRSTLRLSPEDIAAGYALACQSVVEGDVSIAVPPQEKIERRLTTERTAVEVTIPPGYSPAAQPMRRVALTLVPPDRQDQTDDWGRIQTALRQQTGIDAFQISLTLLRRIGAVLRADDWAVTALLEADTWDRPNGPARVVDLWPGHIPDDAPLWGIAVDIGTTTVTLWLVDLMTGAVRAQVAEYNGQIARGEDVISRIIYAGKDSGGLELRDLVLKTINTLIATACKRVQVDPANVIKAAVAGNSTMIHLLLGIPAESIRLAPFVTAVNHIPALQAGVIGLDIHPEATVDCLPGVASYVGADISAGVLSSGLDDAGPVTLFMDVGTNGETVMGNREWLVTCACSAGPAFEGAGVLHGMRATEGAIEEVWINGGTFEPTFRIIGGGKARGVCGSGLIALLAELFLTGVIDRSGNINLKLPTARVRRGEHGPEYVLVWGSETQDGHDIVITRVDIDNLLRAKAAIYAGFTVLAEKVGAPLETAEEVLIGGSFGKYINVEKAVEIGLLPDMPWDRFRFLGNTSVRGAYLALLDRTARARITDIAARMTYIELSADNTFYDAFTSALFLPHTDLARFPTVQAAVASNANASHKSGKGT
ncbi:MAG: ASKHA domain-containing protein [Chloroflexi bacterium]|nr:ASKHA domain-containing protein [Chloroflexota bacterium]MCL5274271.1 ASKHA domain-containing protein [Chloroflexota bacterium]